jgi:polar amino acid transport system substrate-binding protein
VKRRHLRAALVGTAAALAAALTGCASTTTGASDTAISAVSPTTTTSPPPTAPPTTTTTLVPPACRKDVSDVRSYRPFGPPPLPGSMPAGSRMAQIVNDGTLRVGVDETTPYFSMIGEDGHFVGYEVELVRAVARAIFGDVPNIDSKITFVSVTTEEKFEVKQLDLDMVVSVATMSCSRWYDEQTNRNGVLFSSPYYSTTQQIVVRDGSPITNQNDLVGKRVCVTTTAGGPSSSQTLLRGLNDAYKNDKIHIVKVFTRPECLIKLQDGKVDAFVLPASIAAGLIDQDTTVHALQTDVFDSEHKRSTSTYGIVLNPEHPDLMRFVNSLLAQWHDDGSLARWQSDNLAPLPIVVPDIAYRD